MVKVFIALAFLSFKTLSADSQTNIAILDSVEQKINAAYNHSLSGDTSALSKIMNDLGHYTTSKGDHYQTYWQAYATYKYAIAVYGQNRKLSESKTTFAIGLLEAIPNKNTEDYVLLGSLTSFSLKFSTGETAILSQKARNYYQKALELDKNNLRAYFSIGRSDYYRPKQYGGGEIAEQNFLKALSLPLKSDNRAYAPTWGKLDTYELLVAFYVREERKGDAIIYCKKGLQEFPESSALTQQLKTLGQ